MRSVLGNDEVRNRKVADVFRSIRILNEIMLLTVLMHDSKAMVWNVKCRSKVQYV